MRCFYTKDKKYCDYVLSVGGRKIAECNDVASNSKIYMLDVSQVDVALLDDAFSYQFFSVEHPTMMF